MASSYASSIPVPTVEYVTNRDRSTYCVRAVTDYDEELPGIDIPSSHSTTDLNEWFTDLLDVSCGRLQMINGHSLGEDSCNPLRCEFCQQEITGAYRRCDVDEVDMCNKCHDTKKMDDFSPRVLDVDEKDHLKDYVAKLEVKEKLAYAKRQNMLEECTKKHVTRVMKDVLVCKLCDASSLIVSGEWKTFTSKDGVTYMACAACLKWIEECTTRKSAYCGWCGEQKKGEGYFDLRHTDPKYNHNEGMCEGCKNVVLSSTTTIPVEAEDTYGSLMEWIPLVMDLECGHMLLYNTSKSSRWYHKVALIIVDDHGRSGFNFISGTLEGTIRELHGLDKEYQDMWPPGKHRNWKAHYTSPICRMARNRDKQVQFG